MVDIRNVNLDIRTDSMSRNLDKPSLTDKVAQSIKHQFKPAMGDERAPVKEQEDSSDLGLDLEPFPPVKLRMGQ